MKEILLDKTKEVIQELKDKILKDERIFILGKLEILIELLKEIE